MDADPDPEPGTSVSIGGTLAQPQAGSRVPMLLTLFLVLALVALAKPANAQDGEPDHALKQAGLLDDDADPGSNMEIGRASCRERVCQYV